MFLVSQEVPDGSQSARAAQVQEAGLATEAWVQPVRPSAQQSLPGTAWPRTSRKSGSCPNFHSRIERSAPFLPNSVIAYDIFVVRCTVSCYRGSVLIRFLRTAVLGRRKSV